MNRQAAICATTLAGAVSAEFGCQYTLCGVKLPRTSTVQGTTSLRTEPQTYRDQLLAGVRPQRVLNRRQVDQIDLLQLGLRGRRRGGKGYGDHRAVRVDDRADRAGRGSVCACRGAARAFGRTGSDFARVGLRGPCGGDGWRQGYVGSPHRPAAACTSTGTTNRTYTTQW
jgi:hypothetical protein